VVELLSVGTAAAATGRWTYRSSDGGDTWKSIGLGLDGLPVHVLRIDPSGSVLYAGTDHWIFEFDARRTHSAPNRPTATGAEVRSLR
jgi:hypothetical protein